VTSEQLAADLAARLAAVAGYESGLTLDPIPLG
jgi:hypothetical protein